VKYPFSIEGGRIGVLMTPGEREVLRAVPILLRSVEQDEGAPAWSRLRAVGHLDDPGAAAEFVELTAGMLETAKTADLDRLDETLEDDLLDPADAECWMRAIGEARLAVAARLGIEDDGWEESGGDGELVETTVLRVLGYLQDALVTTLTERL